MFRISGLLFTGLLIDVLTINNTMKIKIYYTLFLLPDLGPKFLNVFGRRYIKMFLKEAAKIFWIVIAHSIGNFRNIIGAG